MFWQPADAENQEIQGVVSGDPCCVCPGTANPGYANIVGRERVIAGADCGFATFAFVDNAVAPSVVWAKLAALAEGARIATDGLWN